MRATIIAGMLNEGDAHLGAFIQMEQAADLTFAVNDINLQSIT